MEDDPADGLDDTRADLEEAVTERRDLGPPELRALRAEAQLLEEDVGGRRREETKLVPEEARAARAVELEAVVKLLDAVLAVAWRSSERA